MAGLYKQTVGRLKINVFVIETRHLFLQLSFLIEADNSS